MNRILTACALLCVAASTGCRTNASSAATSDSTSSSGTDAPRSAPAAVAGPASLPDGRYTLVVHGMSCPKCISNVELQLTRIKGVVRPVIDMQHGFVLIEVEGGTAPTKLAITDAVIDSGFTLVEIRGGGR